jgi:hypothetical protein
VEYNVYVFHYWVVIGWFFLICAPVDTVWFCIFFYNRGCPGQFTYIYTNLPRPWS